MKKAGDPETEGRKGWIITEALGWPGPHHKQLKLHFFVFVNFVQSWSEIRNGLPLTTGNLKVLA